MSKEFKAPRDIATIQAEYQQTCTKYGHISYQANSYKRDAEMLFDSLKELNFEAIAAQKVAADAEKAKAAAEAAAEAEKAPKLEAVPSTESTSV